MQFSENESEAMQPLMVEILKRMVVHGEMKKVSAGKGVGEKDGGSDSRKIFWG